MEGRVPGEGRVPVEGRVVGRVPVEGRVVGRDVLGRVLGRLMEGDREGEGRETPPPEKPPPPRPPPPRPPRANDSAIGRLTINTVLNSTRVTRFIIMPLLN